MSGTNEMVVKVPAVESPGRSSRRDRPYARWSGERADKSLAGATTRLDLNSGWASTGTAWSCPSQGSRLRLGARSSRFARSPMTAPVNRPSQSADRRCGRQRTVNSPPWMPHSRSRLLVSMLWAIETGRSAEYRTTAFGPRESIEPSIVFRTTKKVWLNAALHGFLKRRSHYSVSGATVLQFGKPCPDSGKSARGASAWSMHRVPPKLVPVRGQPTRRSGPPLPRASVSRA